MSPEELAARLKADPEFAARWKRDRAERIRQRQLKQQEETTAIVSELRAVGVEVQSLSDLIARSKPYPNAIPILLHHLVRPYSDGVRETIARALAVPDARSAWPTFVDEYRKIDVQPSARSGVKDGLACVLAATVTTETIPELISLATDGRNGTSRLLLLSGLRRSRSAQAKKAIEELAFDPQLAVEIASWRKNKKKHDH